MRIAVALIAFVALPGAPAAAAPAPQSPKEESTVAETARVSPWAAALPPVDVTNAVTRGRGRIRLYDNDGAINDDARAAFDEVAANGGDVHPLAVRLQQLVFKAAYHFRTRLIRIVSGFRENAGRHGTGDALDFKLEGVSAARLAAYLRGFPRVGVGVYTHPRTQFVHLDVREASYHWLDASPPGVKWREAMLRDPSAKKRDATWTAQMDEPLYEEPRLLSIAYLRK